MRPCAPSGVRSGAPAPAGGIDRKNVSEGLKMASIGPATPDILSVFDRFFAPHSCSLRLFWFRQRPTFDCIILAFPAHFHVPQLVWPCLLLHFIVTPFSPFCQSFLAFPDFQFSSATNYFKFYLTKNKYYLILRCRSTHKIQ